MKRKQIGKLVYLLVILVLMCSGCGGGIPDMTDAQREAISEYAVQLLLKYDSNQTSRLVDLDTLEAEPEPTKQPKPSATNPPTGMEETADTPVIDVYGEPEPAYGDIHDALGLPDTISVEYADSYMERQCVDSLSEELIIEASEGKTLFVCRLVLVNDGASKQSVDMLRGNIQYQLVVDGKTVNCLMTMLSNDLTTYMGILEADESRKVQVLTEIEKEIIEQAEEIYLYIQSDNGQGIIKVK